MAAAERVAKARRKQKEFGGCTSAMYLFLDVGCKGPRSKDIRSALKHTGLRKGSDGPSGFFRGLWACSGQQRANRLVGQSQQMSAAVASSVHASGATGACSEDAARMQLLPGGSGASHAAPPRSRGPHFALAVSAFC